MVQYGKSEDDKNKTEELRLIVGPNGKCRYEPIKKEKETGLSGPAHIIGENGKTEGITYFEGNIRKQKSEFKVKKGYFPNKEPYSSCRKILGGKNSYLTGEGLELIAAEGISGESVAITLYDIITKKSALAHLSEFDSLQEITIENIIDKMLKDKFSYLDEHEYYKLEATIIGNKLHERNIKKIKENLRKQNIPLVAEELTTQLIGKNVYLQCETGNIEVYLNQSETENLS